MIAKSLTVRRLGRDDLPAMHELLTVFGEAFDEEETYGAARPDDAYLSNLLGDETFIALVAVEDESVVGGIAAYELRKFERARSEIYIYDLAVSKSHRRRGVATALIRKTTEIAAACGAWVVFVQADLEDEPAVTLYTKLGVREDVLNFDIEVPSRSS